MMIMMMMMMMIDKAWYNLGMTREDWRCLEEAFTKQRVGDINCMD